MQTLTLALLVVLIFLVVQLFRRTDEITRAIQELEIQVKRQTEATKASEKPRY
jgi:hypothetical protein